jgi:hypothetical protein
MMKLRPNGYLQDKTNIIKDFKERMKAGKPCNPNAIAQDDSSLYGAISLNYKSYDHFLKKLGLDPDEIRKYRKWSQDKIKFELNEIYDKDGTFNSRTNYKLASAIISRYGSLDGGLEKLSFTRDKDNYLKKLCPSCGMEIINRYDSRSEYCESCRGKVVKM